MKLTKQDFRECGALAEHADTVVNFGLDTVGTRMALLAREAEDGKIKFSLRAKEPDTVSDIAQAFGGGGHPQASGITMNGTLDEAADRPPAPGAAAEPRPDRGRNRFQRFGGRYRAV